MSLTSAASVLAASLRNFQDAVQVTSNNIANSNTVGFSRRRVEFSETIPQFDGSLVLGGGSYISSLSRLRDVFLDNQIRTQLSLLGYNNALSSSLDQLRSYFPDISNPADSGGISNLITSFYDAWGSLAAAPGSNAAKQVVIADAVALTNRLRQTMQDLTNLRTNLDTQVSATVTDINILIDRIAAYNGLLAQGGQSNAVMDAREKDMQSLAALVDVQFRTTSSGSVSVFFSKGTLVSGSVATKFQTVTGLPDPSLVKIGYPAGNNPSDVTSYIQGGKLGGLLQARDKVLEKAIFGIQAIGSGLIENTNLIYHAAKDASGAHAYFFTGNNSGDIQVNTVLTGSTTGAALLSQFAPTSTAGDLATAMSGARANFTASYVQSQSAIAAVYSDTLSISSQPATAPTPFAASGRIHIDLSSGSAAVVDWTNTQSLQTIAKNITAALAGAGTAVYDESTRKFTILTSQSVSLYDETGNLARVLRLRTFLNSATNINANLDPTVNAGTGNEALNSNNALLRYFEEAVSSGTYSVNNANVNWTNNQDINTISNNIIFGTGLNILAYYDTPSQRVIQFKNNNAPTVGNPLTSFSGADSQGNFAQLAAIQAPSSLSNTYAGVKSGIEQQATLADTQLDAVQGVVDDLQHMQDNVSKVNKDEELANALNYRMAYEASIRVMTVIDQMLNVLINHTSSSSSAVDTSSLQ